MEDDGRRCMEMRKEDDDDRGDCGMLNAEGVSVVG
jgi:hypothetical protein